MMKQIGMVGAGIMASGMARNFLRHGLTVHVWNHTPERLTPLEAAGATVEGTPKKVAEKSDIVIECVSDDAASRGVWLGEQGILTGATQGKVLIASSSLSLGWIDELARTAAGKSLTFLDAPLTGSRP